MSNPYRERPLAKRRQTPSRWRRFRDWWHWFWCHRLRLWKAYGEVETWWEGYGDDRVIMVGFRCYHCNELHGVHQSTSTASWREELKGEWWRTRPPGVLRIDVSNMTSEQAAECVEETREEWLRKRKRVVGRRVQMPQLPPLPPMPKLPSLNIPMPQLPRIEMTWDKIVEDLDEDDVGKNRR